jgi:DNA-binding transcriptional MerR regulator
MIEAKKFLIGELASRAGVTPRTIRYYTSEGLLPDPELTDNRNYYTQAHVDRLELIDRLKRRYLPLQEIKHILENSSPADIHKLLEMQDAFGENATRAPGLVKENSSAQDYIDWLTTQPAWNSAKGTLPSRGHHKTPAALPQSNTRQPTGAETWTHLALAPGVELHFIEGLDAKTTRQVEELVRFGRQLLSK